MQEDNQNPKIIIPCPNQYCGTKLSIPDIPGILRVSCPKCYTSFTHPHRTSEKEKKAASIKTKKRHPILLSIILMTWFISIASSISYHRLTFLRVLIPSAAAILAWFLLAWFLNKVQGKQIKWYYQKWFIFLMFFTFAPIGIALAWSGPRFKKAIRIILTIIFAALYIWIYPRGTPQRLFSPRVRFR